MANKAEELITLDPRDAEKEVSPNIAARPVDLSGKIIGLLSNNKPNSELLLRGVADLIAEKYEIKEIIEANKGSHQRPAPPEMIADLASRCDVVIAATAE